MLYKSRNEYQVPTAHSNCPGAAIDIFQLIDEWTQTVVEKDLYRQ